MTTSYPSADDVLVSLSREILDRGRESCPRGRRTLEITPAVFTLTNPRARRITNQHRRWNEALAVGELSWHLAGSDDLDAIAYYAKAWRSFSDDGRTIQGSCYGHKFFARGESGISQWDRVKTGLISDRETRRAVLTTADPHEDLRPSTRDVPCLTALQFLIRDGDLHAVAFMRSNDLIWGLCYDLYVLTMLQELLAAELSVGLGSYTHIASSMHVYEHHWEMTRRIAESRVAKSAVPMKPIKDPSQKDAFLRLERALRQGRDAPAHGLDSFWSDLAVPLRRLSQRRHAQMQPPLDREAVV